MRAIEFWLINKRPEEWSAKVQTVIKYVIDENAIADH